MPMGIVHENFLELFVKRNVSFAACGVSVFGDAVWWGKPRASANVSAVVSKIANAKKVGTKKKTTKIKTKSGMI